MSSAGLCVSPGCLPSPNEVAELRPGFLRSVLYSINDLDRLKAYGLPILLTLNTEFDLVGQDWSGWYEAVDTVAQRAQGQVLLVECGNELDTLGVPVDQAAELVRIAAPVLHDYGIQCGAGSVAGPDWQGYLADLAARCRADADTFGAHFYGQRPEGFEPLPWGFGDLRVAISRAYEIAGRPIVCSEEGVKIADAGGETQVASFLTCAAATFDLVGPSVCPHWSWFAWHDGVGAPGEQGDQAFGMMAADGRQRPAWDTFAGLSASIVAPPRPSNAELRAGLTEEIERLTALRDRIPV